MQSNLASEQRHRLEEFQARHRVGLVALVFTDIVGSTRLKQSLGEREAIIRIQRHHAMVRELLGEFTEAQEIGTAGDSFLLAFTRPSEAVKFSLLLQARLQVLGAGTEDAVLDRIGIHVGEVFVQEREGTPDLLGSQVDVCARVMSLAEANQVLMTRFAFDNARRMVRAEELEGIDRLNWLNHGQYLVKGVEEPVEICEVRPGLGALTPPPANSEKAQRVVGEGELVLGWRPAVGQPVPNSKWVLVEKLGEGGFGEVWLSRHQTLKEQRVFKFCFRADRIRTLKREVTLFRLLQERSGDHPHIVRLLEVNFDHPPFSLEEEYVAGKDLQCWCDRQGGVAAVPLATKLELVAQTAEALQAAHEAGVIHRDVKPGNILIAQAAGAGQEPSVKLTDFGIGQVVSQEFLNGVPQTAFTMTMLSDTPSQTGTQLYMAPELWAGKPASTRSDIYSLGVVLYQLLVDNLSRPVATDWEQDVADPLLRDDLRLCFAGDPQARFAGAGQLAERLRRLSERRLARQREEAEQKARERRGYRRGILQTGLVATLVVLVVVLMAVYATSKKHEAEKRREEAVEQRQEAQDRAEESRKNLARLNVAYGLQLVDQGDLLGSLPWLIQALRMDEGKPRDEDMHRLRIATVLQQCPRLVQAWWFDTPIILAGFGPEGRTIITALKDGTVRLWDASTGQPVAPELKHAGGIRSAALSPDGRRIATGGKDGALQIWDAATSRPVLPPIQHPAAPDRLAFSPDGSRLVSATEAGSLSVWDMGTGQLVKAIQNAEAVNSLSFHPSDDLILTAGEGGVARVWDARTGAEVGRPRKHDKPIRWACFSPDGRLVITASEDSTGRIWDTQTGEPVSEPLRHSIWLTEARFSPDNQRALTTSFDGMAKVWDVATGRPALPALRHPHSVMGGSFSQDGRRIATACFDHSALIWDADSGERLLSPLKHSGHVAEALFSPDGRRVLAVGGDQTMRLWDLAVGAAVVPTLEHGDRVQDAAFSADGTRLVTASLDGTARVWDASTGRAVIPALRHAGGVNQARFSPDGQHVLTASEDGTARIWGATNGHELGPSMAHAGPVWSAAFSPDGGSIFTVAGPQGTNRAAAMVWDARSRQLKAKPLPLPDGLRQAAFSADGSKIVTGTTSGTAQLWDVATGEPIGRPMLHRGPVAQVNFSPDGRQVVTCCQDGTYAALYARVWDVTTGAPISPPLDHKDGVLDACFSPDGQRVVTASEDGTVGIWEAPTGRLLVPFLRHNYQVHHAAFSPDGRRVITASRDKTARVWDAQTGEPCTPPLRHQDRVTFAAFDPTGSRMVSCSVDGKARLWDLRKDDRPLEDLRRLADLLNCSQFATSTGSGQIETIVPVSSAALHEAWPSLRSKYPGDFQVPETAILAWQRQEVEEALKAGRWAVALAQLDRLLLAVPGDATLLDYQARARTELARRVKKSQ